MLIDELRTALAQECTGQDDHDPAPCPKCSRMAEALADVVVAWITRTFGEITGRGR